MTAVAPASTGYDASNEYYKDDREYVFAIAEALREEYLEIVNAGLILQVDDAVLANMYDHLVQHGSARYRQWAELRVDALNYALRGIPEDRIRYHVCFGSWHVPHVADAPLDAIVHLILKVHAGAYAIEAANVRHEHEWRVWQTVKLPPGKILIPGVVTHHTTTVEHPRLVADRIIQFAKLVGREHVIAGTDCGFAQVETFQRVHPQVMWAKLATLSEGARLASQELWGLRLSRRGGS
jgi:5-methyltetrahydropteroyltriglutamate--homocysteine methyltransferase